MQELMEQIDFALGDATFSLSEINSGVYQNEQFWKVFLGDDNDQTYSQVQQWKDVHNLLVNLKILDTRVIASTNIAVNATNIMDKTRDDMNAWLSQIDDMLGELLIVAGAAAKEDTVSNLLEHVIDNTADLLTENTYVEVEAAHEMFFDGHLSRITELISGDTGPQEDYEQDYDTPEGEEYDTPQDDDTPDNDYDQEVLNDFDEGAIDDLQSGEFNRVFEGSILPFFAQKDKGDFWGGGYPMPTTLPILDAITIGDYTIDAYSLPVAEGNFAGSAFMILHDLSATGYAIGFVWSLILLGRREYRYYMSLGRDGGGE